MKRSVPFYRCVLSALGLVSASIFFGPSPANAAAAQASKVAEATIDVSQTGAPISPYIYGQFIEHLGRCIYGGIWAEMLEDRKFYYPVPAQAEIWRTTREQARVLAASPWKVIGPSGTVRMATENAFVGEHSPHVELPGNGNAVGLYQEELGLLKGRAYSGYLILAGDGDVGPVTVSLEWGSNDSEKAVRTIREVSPSYTKIGLEFAAGADTDNGRLVIIASGAGTLKLGAVSLMPADNVEGFRSDTLNLLRQLNSPVYRWPGGNFVSGYDWRDGLGDRDKRPTRTNPAWTGIEPNDVGMDEFVRLCELIGAEPMIAVNTGFGDAYSAAAEVEYANGSSDTPMGSRRARNGRREPYGVKWWCVGNEMYGRWQLGYMQLNHYVLKHNWIEGKMREVDPSIKTVGVGNVGEWTKGMLSNCAGRMDLISEHFYCRERDDLVEHVLQIPDNVKRIADAHRSYRETIPSLKTHTIPVALDEWNFWYGPHVFGELGTRYYLKDALGIAAGLHEFFRNSDIFFMANYAQTVNVIGCIKTTKTHADFDSTAFPLMLYRRHFGTIPVRLEQTASPLDLAAALTEDKQALTVAAVNPTRDVVELKILMKGATPVGKASSWLLTADHPMAFNQPGEPRQVDIRETANAEFSPSVSIPPTSVTLWKFPIQ